MAGTSEKDQKTELPTHKKLKDSAREGDVLMSKELATALMMLAGAGWLFAAGGWLVDSAGELVKRGLTLDAGDIAHFAPGEAVMRVHAVGVNWADTHFRKGSYFIKAQFPQIAGMEAAGEIIALGEGTEGLSIGDRVMALGSNAYAEKMIVKPLYCYPIHREGAYQHLMTDHDREMFEAVKTFNPYDLYSKSDERVSVEKLRPYYEDLIAEYFPEKIRW